MSGLGSTTRSYFNADFGLNSYADIPMYVSSPLTASRLPFILIKQKSRARNYLNPILQSMFYQRVAWQQKQCCDSYQEREHKDGY